MLHPACSRHALCLPTCSRHAAALLTPPWAASLRPPPPPAPAPAPPPPPAAALCSGGYTWKVEGLGGGGLRGSPPGRSLESPPFSVASGRLHFLLRLFPGGDGREASAAHVSLALVLLTPGVQIEADVELTALNQKTGLPLVREAGRAVSLGDCVDRPPAGDAWALPRFLSHARAASFADELFPPPDGLLILGARVSVTNVWGESATVSALHALPASPRADASTRSPIAVAVPPKSMANDFAAMLASGELSDVRFVLSQPAADAAEGLEAKEPVVLRAHRFVLCSRSEGLKALLSSAAGRSGSVELSDVDAQSFKQLLHFLYTDELRSPPDAREALPLLRLSIRFALPRLAAICASAIAADLRPDNAAAAFAAAESMRCAPLRRAALEYIQAHEGPVRASAGWAELRASQPRAAAEVERVLGGPAAGAAVVRSSGRAVEKSSVGPVLYAKREEDLYRNSGF